MADDIQAFRVISQGGLNTSDNYLLMSDQEPGQATRLVNYESNTDGGYRRINGYKKINETYYTVPGEGKVLGCWNFYDSVAKTDTIIAARKVSASNSYKVFKLTGGGWTEMVTGTTRVYTGVNKVRGELVNFGAGDALILVDGVNRAAVFMNNTWYNLSSSNTGGTGSPGGDQVLNAPAFITVFRNHVFMSGDSSASAVVCHCAPNDILTWTVAAGGGQIPVGFPVVQIKPFRDENFVFGKDRIKKIVVSGTDFVLQDVTNSMGCISSDSVIEVGGNLFFWSTDGVRPVAGTERNNDVELSLLSQTIQRLINKYATSYDLVQLVGVAVKKKTQFRYFLPIESQDVSLAMGIIGCLRMGQNKDPVWEFGELMGIKPSCIFSGYQGTKEIVLFGDFNGNVYLQEEGNSFDGRNIVSIYQTPYFDLGATQIRKNLKTLQIFTKSDGAFNINYNVQFDWDNVLSINPADYVLAASVGSGTYDGSFKYDASNKYSGDLSSVLRQNIQGSGFSFQYSFVTDDTNPPHIIQSFVTEYSAKGRS